MVNFPPNHTGKNLYLPFKSAQQNVGVAFVAIVGSVSLIATIVILCYITWHGWLSPFARCPSLMQLAQNPFPKFIRSPPGRYLTCLFVSNLFHGIGYSMGYYWATKHTLPPGPLCDAQGTSLQIGNLGCAIWSFALAYHTFYLLYLNRHPPKWVCPTVLVIGWTLAIALPSIGSAIAYPQRLYYSTSGAWCCVSTLYNGLQLVYFLIPAHLSIIANFTFYGLVWYRTRKMFRGAPMQDAMFATVDSVSFADSGQEAVAYRRCKIGTHVLEMSRKLLLYPIIYSILVIPLSIVKFGYMTGWRSPFALACTAGCFVASTGWVDVSLFFYTRKTFIREARVAASPLRGRSSTTSPATAPMRSLGAETRVDLRETV